MEDQSDRNAKDIRDAMVDLLRDHYERRDPQAARIVQCLQCATSTEADASWLILTVDWEAAGTLRARLLQLGCVEEASTDSGDPVRRIPRHHWDTWTDLQREYRQRWHDEQAKERYQAYLARLHTVLESRPADASSLHTPFAAIQLDVLAHWNDMQTITLGTAPLYWGLVRLFETAEAMMPAKGFLTSSSPDTQRSGKPGAAVSEQPVDGMPHVVWWVRESVWMECASIDTLYQRLRVLIHVLGVRPHPLQSHANSREPPEAHKRPWKLQVDQWSRSQYHWFLRQLRKRLSRFGGVAAHGHFDPVKSVSPSSRTY